MPWLAVMAAMRDGAEIGPDHARADQAEMRRDEEAVDLLVGVVGEREDDPVRAGAGFARFHRDAADDAVAAGRRRNADFVAVGAIALDHRGEVDRLGARGSTRTDSTARPMPGHGEPHQGRQEKGYGERNDPQRFCLSSEPQEWNGIGIGREA